MVPEFPTKKSVPVETYILLQGFCKVPKVNSELKGLKLPLIVNDPLMN
jgi:hypothetical protein